MKRAAADDGYTRAVLCPEMSSVRSAKTIASVTVLTMLLAACNRAPKGFIATFIATPTATSWSARGVSIASN